MAGRNSRFFKHGVPMIAFMVFGTVGLSQFISGKHEISDIAQGKRSLTTREFDLEEDYKKTLKKLDVGYENQRIPRPADETEED